MPLQFGGLFGALQVRETPRDRLRKSRLLHGIVAPEPRADHLQQILLKLTFHALSSCRRPLVPRDRLPCQIALCSHVRYSQTANACSVCNNASMTLFHKKMRQCETRVDWETKRELKGLLTNARWARTGGRGAKPSRRIPTWAEQPHIPIIG